MSKQQLVYQAIVDGYDTQPKIVAHTGLWPHEVKVSVNNLNRNNKISAKTVRYTGEGRSVYSIDFDADERAKEPVKPDTTSIVAQAMKTQPNSVWALGR